MKNRTLASIILIITLISYNVPGPFHSDAATSKTALMNAEKLTPVKTRYEELDVLVDALFDRIFTDGMTTYDKVKACYDHIIKESHDGPYARDYNAEIIMYNEGYLSVRDANIVNWAYHFLTKYSGVGDEYASAFVVLTRAIGLESYLIDGDTAMSGGGTAPHKWANIKIDGTYYTFDPKAEYNITARRSDGKITYGRFFATDKDMEGRIFCTDREKDVSSFNGFKKYGFFKISAEPERRGKIRVGTELLFRVSSEGQAETFRFFGMYIYEGATDYFNTDKGEKLIDVHEAENTVRWTADRAGTFTLCILCKDGRERESRYFISYEIKPKTGLILEGEYASGISAGTFYTELPLKEGDTFTDGKGVALSENDPIGTGDILVSGEKGYRVFVKGDTDGDGALTVTDYLKVKRHILKVGVLQDEFFRAADADGSGSVTSTDYVLIKMHLLKITDIYAL